MMKSISIGQLLEQIIAAVYGDDLGIALFYRPGGFWKEFKNSLKIGRQILGEEALKNGEALKS